MILNLSTNNGLSYKTNFTLVSMFCDLLQPYKLWLTYGLKVFFFPYILTELFSLLKPSFFQWEAVSCEVKEVSSGELAVLFPPWQVPFSVQA